MAFSRSTYAHPYTADRMGARGDCLDADVTLPVSVRSGSFLLRHVSTSGILRELLMQLS
jgi:hypothetical protein